MDKLYDVALDEAAGGKAPPDLVERVEQALEENPLPPLEDDMPPARWWFAPFGTAAAAAVILLAGYLVFTQTVGRDVANVNSAYSPADNNAAPAMNSSVTPRPDTNYAIVRSVSDLRALGDDIAAIQCDGVGLAEVSEIARRSFPSLTQLHFVRCDFDDRAMDEIKTLGALTQIVFEACNAITPQSLVKLGEMQNLKTLVFRRCEKISEADVASLRATRPDMEITVDTDMSAEPPERE